MYCPFYHADSEYFQIFCLLTTGRTFTNQKGGEIGLISGHQIERFTARQVTGGPCYFETGQQAGTGMPG